MIREWLAAHRERNRRVALEERATRMRLERVVELRELKYRTGEQAAELQLIEDVRLVGAWDPLAPWRDRFDRGLDFARGGTGGGGTTSKIQNQSGADFPFYRTETELDQLRDASRLLTRMVSNASGLLRGYRSYVIGTGAVVRVSARRDDYQETATKAQRVVDHFLLANKWNRRHKEYFTRSRRDGDGLLRLFPQPDGTTRLRFVWPEQVRQPLNEGEYEGWNFGVQRDPDDAETTLAYSVYPAGGGDRQPEIVPADEILQTKINVDTGIPRGVPDFTFGVADRINSADKLAATMGTGSALQAAIAYIRKHTNAPAGTIQAFASGQADRTRQDPVTGREKIERRFDAPTIIDTNANTEFVASPYNAGIPGHLEVGKMLLRSACANWNAPEWLGSSDASNNNFASSLTAESPFIKGVLDEQEVYCEDFEDLIIRVLAHAALCQVLPANVMECVDVTVTLPDPTVRDPLQVAQANQIKIAAGYFSPQMAAEAENIDYRHVVRDMQAVADAGLSAGQPLPIPGAGE